MRTCATCKIEKPLTEYSPCNSAGSFGYYRYCKPCSAERSRLYRQRNNERVTSNQRASTQRWRRTHPLWQKAIQMNNKARYRHGLTAQVTVEELEKILEEYGPTCYLCQSAYEEFDHVVPMARGGEHTKDNLRPVCHDCNVRKWANV